MELKNKSKGQVFIIAAVIFSSLAVLVFVTTMEISQETEEGAVRDFYRNVFNGAPENFNAALESNYSIENARNSIYSYSRFIERSSTSKGIELGASYFIVMPGKGESVFINYRDSPNQIRIYNSETGWNNLSIDSKKYVRNTFSPGLSTFRIVLPERDIDQNFTATSPRIFTSMRLSAQDQIWINSGLN